MRDDRLYLIHIAERIQRIESFTQHGRETFMQSLLLQDAVIRNFEVIGEAARHLSQQLTQSHPEVPWRQVAGFRNLLIHDYMGVSLTQVWEIVERDLLDLKRHVEAILQDVEGRP
ncbi:MAG: DUF86 domain-containing protein [Chloroflexi bacterium]|nr:DUF86 domain-containing protein [Chloroflexota bacterium]